MKSKLITLFSFIFATALIAGCGGSAAMKMHISEVEATANEALRTANTADYNAAIAKKMADEAMSMMQMRMMKGGKMMKGKMGRYNK